MKRLVALLAVAAALAAAAPASAARPVIAEVLALPAETDSVHVVVLTRGRPLTSVHVCDLDTIACVKAHRVAGRRCWMASLPPGTGRVGAIGRSGSDYAFAAETPGRLP